VNVPHLTTDLADLERELASRPTSEPSQDLRRRVLAATQRETSALPRRIGWLAGAAVAALLLINLSMSVSSDMDWLLTDELDQDEIDASARRIHALAPDLPDRETHRLAVVEHVGSRSTPTFVPRPAAHLWGRDEELNRWDTH
jgi:hypothetical protein